MGKFKFDNKPAAPKGPTEFGLKILEAAKRELGLDGEKVVIKPGAMYHHFNDDILFGNVDFPTEKIEERFRKIVQKKLR